MTDDPDNEKFKKDYFPAIGHAIVAWALAEIKLDEILLALLSHPNAKPSRNKRRIVTSDHIPKSFEQRLDLAAEIGSAVYDPITVRALRSILKSARDRYKDRNKLAHGEWTLRFEKNRPPAIFCQIRRQGLPGIQRPFTPKQIKTLAASFETISEQAYQFLLQNHPAGPRAAQLRKYFDSLRQRRTQAAHSAKTGKRHEKHRA